MDEIYNVILKEYKSEIVEKKSRFIASAKPVKSEQEALAYINEVSKKYWDARHNCYAFVVGGADPVKRFSDDREPQGTAGKPILDVLTSGNYSNIVLVVTRYFGGILLGTGGLTRAYSSAAKSVINIAETGKAYSGFKINISFDYSYSGKMKYIISQNNIPLLSADYSDMVSFCIIVPENLIDFLKEKTTEATKASAEFTIIENKDFAVFNSETVIL